MTLFYEGHFDVTAMAGANGMVQPQDVTCSVLVTATSPGSPASRCPIEDAMASLGYVTGSQADISIFTSWGLKLPRTDSLNHFGAVRDVHLYRSRKKPFNHEYILFRFLNVDDAESWLRLERAARLGRHPYTPRPANFRPFTSGVAARETVSFSTSRDLLSPNSDEVAAISLSLPLSSSSSRILLEDLAHAIIRTQATNRLYQLFTVNCRWFARRLFLNTVQWCQIANVAHEITWRGHSSSFPHVSQKLQKEWFGGAHLEGKKGIRLRVEHMLVLAVRLIDRGDAREARLLCEDALESFERANNGSEKDSFLLAYMLVTLGDAIAEMGEPFTALPQLQRACDIMRPLADTRKHMYAHTLTRYACALHTCDRVPEAYATQGEAVNLTRTLQTLEFELVRDLLGWRLHDLGIYQAALEQYSAACVSFEEATSHRSILYASDPSKYLRPLYITLNCYAEALNSASRSHEAIEVSTKAISLMRTACESDPEGARQDLARQLYDLAQYLRSNGDPEALGLAKEALELRRKMHDIAPRHHHPSLRSSLQQCAAICSDLNDTETAYAYCEEAIKMLRELRCEDKGDTALRDELSTTLCNAAYCLAAIEGPQAAAIYFGEAVELDRESYIAEPAKCHSRWVETLSEYAELFDSMGQSDEASRVRDEIERIRSASDRVPLSR